ncbi:16652_t:CDS:2 [Entrophospora sp. SA101]|nr:13446_t:CDS:2 [Entrophospora sp. SA101]CAJ0927745.1 16652_t:CDS:2 [Entrophospora sp. SA101]
MDMEVREEFEIWSGRFYKGTKKILESGSKLPKLLKDIQCMFTQLTAEVDLLKVQRELVPFASSLPFKGRY